MPLDLLYAAAAAYRRTWFERHPEAQRRLQAPVISVGNLSVGGTGKTPLVAQITRFLLDRGERPAILSRGYKRRVGSDGVTVVSDGHRVIADVDVAGDEPLMLARELPDAIVCVSEDRYLAGVVAERTLGATVHVLDDGFQHVQLARDFDVIVTSPDEITRGRVLPRGRLREGRDAAARAHFVVVVNSDADRARTEAWELGISGFSAARRELDGLGEVPSPVVAVAGIGDPAQFFQMITEGQVDVRTTLRFPDHHLYTEADVARIAAAAKSAAVSTVLTTAKDAVRLEPLGTLPFSVQVVPLRLRIDDWDALALSLQQVVERRRSAA